MKIDLGDKVQEGKILVTYGIKKYFYDLVALVILIALTTASLGIFDIIDLKEIDIVQFLISWFPYFAAAIMLHNDLYKKGVFIGKGTTKFCNVIKSYSELANSLTGQQIKGLYKFCDEYNEDARKNMQDGILRQEGLSYIDFENSFVKVINGEEVTIPALKTLDKKSLRSYGYTKMQISCIFKAKRVKVKGITASLLLSSIDVKDITQIGNDEKHLHRRQVIMSTASYIVITLLFSIVALKDITDWGWAGLIVTLFKVAYLLGGCCMSYFRGYDDITIHLANHFMRKTDILKMYVNYNPNKEALI